MKIVIPKWTAPLVITAATILERIHPNTEFGWVVADYMYGYRWYDATKAQQELGWKPKHTTQEAIKRTVEFYKKENLL